MLKDLVSKNRSYRRFHQDVAIPLSELEDMVDHARLTASGRNAQPLKYALVGEAESCGRVFPFLAWAGYYKDWDGPEEGERPAAYIIQLHDTRVAGGYFCDDGIALQTLLLSAVEKGFGGCIIASVRREELSALLGLPSHFEILHVVALGKPKETVVIEPLKDDDIRYWRDEDQVHHVPKRALKDIIVSKI